MNGATADPSPSIINKPKRINTMIIGYNQYFFLSKMKEKIDFRTFNLLTLQI